MTPDSWQTTLLRSSSDRVLVLASRQVGKSQTSAALALKTALLDEALVLLLSPGLRQSGELFLKVLALYRDLGRPIPSAQPRDNSLRLNLSNGSRIISLPGTEATIRGYSSAALLVIDEAARVPDELYLAVRPMLAVSRGSLVCVSSAYAKMGFFYEEYVNGTDRWERYKIKATECPRISQAFLDEEREAMGDLFFDREYNCVFSEATDAVFRDVDLQAMLDCSEEPFFPGA
ncbi:MAG TPA: terminase family protein [Gemmataceae bacterium]|nr:terminase family protein [Gemmataceae bacterium]